MGFFRPLIGLLLLICKSHLSNLSLDRMMIFIIISFMMKIMKNVVLIQVKILLRVLANFVGILSKAVIFVIMIQIMTDAQFVWKAHLAMVTYVLSVVMIVLDVLA